VKTRDPHNPSAAFFEALQAGLEGIDPAAPALLGASGGRDSTALAHGLAALGWRRITLVHLHHGLRGEEADADVKFVRELAKQTGFGFCFERSNVRALAEERRISLEEAGRQARLAFFAETAKTMGVGRVILAHHAEDQAETILHHLFRGTGPRGLLGMERITWMSVESVQFQILRPMLDIPRAIITGFLLAKGHAWREDASNTGAEFTRNRIRAEALPVLRSIFQRDPTTSLLRLRKILHAENEFLDLLAAPLAANETLDAKELSASHPALQRRIVRAWLVSQGVCEPDFALIERVRALAAPGAKIAKTNLPKGWHARRTSGRIYVVRTA
jgi:tRNA(Ile)-lysidine synthase